MRDRHAAPEEDWPERRDNRPHKRLKLGPSGLVLKPEDHPVTPAPATHLVHVGKTGPLKQRVAPPHGLLVSVQLWLLGLPMVSLGCMACLWWLGSSSFPGWQPRTALAATVLVLFSGAALFPWHRKLCLTFLPAASAPQGYRQGLSYTRKCVMENVGVVPAALGHSMSW